MSELKRGRVKHTNSWNYGAATQSGFDSDSRSKIHTGQWVWVAPRSAVISAQPHAKKELGCVRLITGVIIDGYYALDGMRFQTHASQVHAVLQERQAFLDQMKGFREFKAYTVGFRAGPKLLPGQTKRASLHRASLPEPGALETRHQPVVYGRQP